MRLFSLLKLLLLNMVAAFYYKAPCEIFWEGYIIRRMSFLDSFKSVLLFSSVFSGKSYGLLRSSFLVAVARRFSFCVVNERRELVGFEIFRLATRDVDEGTIHESFIGVDSRFNGLGLATSLRSYAMRSLKENGFSGISTRISESNIASLRSAQKLGFQPIERYSRKKGGVEFYLIVRFSNFY